MIWYAIFFVCAGTYCGDWQVDKHYTKDQCMVESLKTINDLEAAFKADGLEEKDYVVEGWCVNSEGYVI